MPGVDEKDVEVQLADGVLKIKGEKKQEREQKEEGDYVMERSYGWFMRQIPIPVEVREDAIEAKFQKGVLSIVMPKTPRTETKSKKIEIKSAS